MRIAIFGLGSRGDVQPYAALGKGLKAAGHNVRLVTNENYKEIATANGLEFCPVSGNVQDIVESPEMRSLIQRTAIALFSARPL
jgi:sterol 3beta-glucosyltransferase